MCSSWGVPVRKPCPRYSRKPRTHLLVLLLLPAGAPPPPDFMRLFAKRSNSGSSRAPLWSSSNALSAACRRLCVWRTIKGCAACKAAPGAGAKPTRPLARLSEPAACWPCAHLNGVPGGWVLPAWQPLVDNVVPAAPRFSCSTVMHCCAVNVESYSPHVAACVAQHPAVARHFPARMHAYARRAPHPHAEDGHLHLQWLDQAVLVVVHLCKHLQAQQGHKEKQTGLRAATQLLQPGKQGIRGLRLQPKLGSYPLAPAGNGRQGGGAIRQRIESQVPIDHNGVTPCHRLRWPWEAAENSNSSNLHPAEQVIEQAHCVQRLLGAGAVTEWVNGGNRRQANMWLQSGCEGRQPLALVWCVSFLNVVAARPKQPD